MPRGYFPGHFCLQNCYFCTLLHQNFGSASELWADKLVCMHIELVPRADTFITRCAGTVCTLSWHPELGQHAPWFGTVCTLLLLLLNNIMRRQLKKVASKVASNLERINEASKNPKRLWTTIKSILHSSPPNEQLSPPVSQSLANSLASFFHQKIVSLKDSIALKLQGSPTPFDFDLPHSGEVLSDFTPVTPAEVSQLLRSMSNKSSPLDYIPTSLLKSCANTFSILISHLANLSFTQATFPSKFKLALISPLLKKPGLPKSDLANFRPISNLNTIGKILERLALSRFFPHISKSPSFSPLQSAYRKFHSTETALLKLTNDIMETIDSGKITILTALDMSAAFDTLDHITLLHRLQHTFGLSGYVISWIRSYLTDRSSFVKIDSSSSPSTTTLTGVPQGFVLGPLLFVLFIAPIANVINLDQSNQNNTVSFHQYADDTQLYIGTNSSTLTTQIASIESCTQRVHDWLLNNGLHLNPSKSEAIAFYNPRSKPLAALAESIGTVSVAGSPIKLQSSIKNLGVYLDSKMSFDKQVSETCKACFFHIRALRHIRASLTTEASKTIAAAIVGSRLDYCNSPGWHIHFKSNSPSACPEYSCSSGRRKTSVLPHHTCSFWFALASGSPQN